MAKELQGMRVAILAADGVERVELEQPRGALYGAGATSDLLSIHPGEIEARQFDMVSAATLAVDRLVSDASVDDYEQDKAMVDAVAPGLLDEILAHYAGRRPAELRDAALASARA